MKESPLNLNKLFPDYFNKIIFRTAIVLLILLFVFTAWSNDWKNEFPYLTCAKTSVNGCFIERADLIDSDAIPESWEGIYLRAGETIGEVPNEHFFLFEQRVYTLLLLTFLANHVLYYFRTGNIKPKVNEKTWNKIKNKLEEKK